MSNLLRDLRIALRSLSRRPLFTTIVILTLALGIGANTAIFSVVNGVLLRPLPYHAPENLALIWSKWTNFEKTWVSDFEYDQYKQQDRLFEDVAAWADNGNVALTGDQGPESVPSAALTSNLLPVLGVPLERGRGIAKDEDVPKGPSVVLVAYDLWKRRYGSDPALVGKNIQIDGKAFSVVGVLPRSFRLPLEFQLRTRAQLFVPLQLDPANIDGGSHSYFAVARLRPGITVPRVTRDLEALTTQWAGDPNHPVSMRFSAFAVAMNDEVNGGIKTPLVVLLASVGLLLLIACANVANLLLTRADGRVREVAVRSALGAGQGRLLRLALVESVALALAGGVVGAALAWVGVRALASGAPTSVPRAADLGVDGVVLGFTLLLSAVTGLLFGAAPAFRSSRVDLVTSLKEGGRSGSEGRSRRRGRDLLVAAEMGIAVVLVIGAGLTLRSFQNLVRLDPGFDAHNVLTLRLALPEGDYPATPELVRFYDQVGAEVKRVPGVTAAGFVRVLPLAAEIGDAGIQIEGRPIPPGEPNLSADWQVVTPGYFEAMRIPLIRGRFFDQTDTPDGLPVIAVNQTLAKEYFPGEDPLGRRIKVGGGPQAPWRTIVGLVGDTRHNGLTKPPKRAWFIPHNQFATAFGSTRRAMTLVARTSGDPRSLVPAVEQLIHRRDANLAITEIATLDDVMAIAVQEQRFLTTLMTGFGILALSLAAIGIYGVISYSVTQRTQEIGIRLALGADRWKVRRLVVQQGMAPALAGTVVGVGGAALLSQFMRTLLYGVAPLDALTYTAIPILLMAVAFAAALIPASRATRVEPVEALRHD
ncbi:MAG: ABC transporter permease [Gemmatimonadota bacterium]